MPGRCRYLVPRLDAADLDLVLQLGEELDEGEGVPLVPFHHPRRLHGVLDGLRGQDRRVPEVRVLLSQCLTCDKRDLSQGRCIFGK